MTGVDIGRTLAGDPQPEYRETYLKDDMSHACWSGEHLFVLAIATLLWLAYAVGFPLAMAWVIAKDKAAAGRRAAGADQGSGDGGSQYWHSTRPLVEKYWLRPGAANPRGPGAPRGPLNLDGSVGVLSTEFTCDLMKATRHPPPPPNPNPAVG